MIIIGSKFQISLLGREALKPARYEERKLCSSGWTDHIMPTSSFILRGFEKRKEDKTYHKLQRTAEQWIRYSSLLEILLALGVTELSPDPTPCEQRLGGKTGIIVVSIPAKHSHKLAQTQTHTSIKYIHQPSITTYHHIDSHTHART